MLTTQTQYWGKGLVSKNLKSNVLEWLICDQILGQLDGEFLGFRVQLLELCLFPCSTWRIGGIWAWRLPKTLDYGAPDVREPQVPAYCTFTSPKKFLLFGFQTKWYSVSRLTVEDERCRALGAEGEWEVKKDGLWELRRETGACPPRATNRRASGQAFGAWGGSQVPGVQDDAEQRQGESWAWKFGRGNEWVLVGCECQSANINGGKSGN